MPAITDIADPDDPRLDAYRELRDPDRARRTGLLVAEGRFVVGRILDSGRYRLESLLVSPAAYDAMRPAVDKLPDDTPVYVLPPAAIRQTAGFAVHQGCVALAERNVERSSAEVLSADPRTVVVLEGLADPDNVGSIFRSALALGAGAVVIGAGTADPLYRKAIRTSMGAVFDLPYGRSADLAADVRRMRAGGFLTAALTPAASATPITTWAREVTPAQQVALLVGNEGRGLSDAVLCAADVHLRIPMRPDVDSLNVHVAVAVALSHLARL